MGIRFFDLRIDRNLNIRHGATYSDGQNLETALDNYKSFLERHPSEFVVLRIKDESERINGRDTA
ncbi:UNVERIFIED_CONTAM: hypothetical protein O8I53_09205 [Campylobacter lari]